MSSLREQLAGIKKEWTINEVVAVILNEHKDLDEVFICVSERSDEFFNWFSEKSVAENYCKILSGATNEPFNWYRGVRQVKINQEAGLL